MTTAEHESQTWQTADYSSSVTIGEFFKTIKRNAGVFWTTLVTVLLLGVVVSLLIPAKYAAASEVLVEGAAANGQVSTPDNVLAELSIPNAAFALTTLVELLQSQEVYFRVLDASGIKAPTTKEELDALPKVFVRQKEDSNIFIVTVEGGKKEDVIKMAQNYAEEFRKYADSFRKEASSNAVQFMQGKIDEEKALLKQAENEFTAFKSANQVVDSTAELQFRLGLVSTTEQALSDARAREASAIAAVNILKQELSKIPEVRERVAEFNNMQIILDIKKQLTLLNIKRVELLQVYQPTAKQVKEVDAQIKVQEQFLAEQEKELKPNIKESNPEWDNAQRRYSEALAEREAAISRAAELQQLSDNRTNRLNQLANLTKDQREYERKLVEHTQTVSNMTELLNRVKLRDNNLKSGVQALTRAVFPQQSQPNWIINMAIATILGLTLAVVFSMVRDSVQDRVNSKEEAFLLSGLSPLAHIPERSRSKHPIITNPQTNMAFESYRVLRSNIAVHSRRADLKTLTVTSTLRKEGKSVIAANLAVAYVLNGQRTILVDANLRYPNAHTLFGLNEKPGLGDLLLGTATVNDVLQPSSVDGLYIVTAGTVPANATEVIGSPRMQEIINLLSEQCDMVIFDAPHVSGLADAQSLAAVTDAAVIVTEIGKPSKSEYKEAVSILDAASPALLGMVENKVSAKEAHLTKI
ncbi:MAG: polysaccharide biosynthesis tyrosine autokinase [Fimbriimonadaceae bacterium]|nr:MAG: polysaccharide biosynthesis tyrosine autokinase [Fimbriimonadaceae bacterium]